MYLPLPADSSTPGHSACSAVRVQSRKRGIHCSDGIGSHRKLARPGGDRLDKSVRTNFGDLSADLEDLDLLVRFANPGVEEKVGDLNELDIELGLQGFSDSH